MEAFERGKMCVQLNSKHMRMKQLQSVKTMSRDIRWSVGKWGGRQATKWMGLLRIEWHILCLVHNLLSRSE